ncbi:hypothetical protein L9F63_014562, partial [Diploptera punctata]
RADLRIGSGSSTLGTSTLAAPARYSSFAARDTLPANVSRSSWHSKTTCSGVDIAPHRGHRSSGLRPMQFKYTPRDLMSGKISWPVSPTEDSKLDGAAVIRYTSGDYSAWLFRINHGSNSILVSPT